MGVVTASQRLDKEYNHRDGHLRFWLTTHHDQSAVVSVPPSGY